LEKDKKRKGGEKCGSKKRGVGRWVYPERELTQE